jgi:hypothetical protein
MALHRLYQIPRGLYSGQLRLSVHRRLRWGVAAAAAYGVLLLYTAALCIAAGKLLWAHGGTLSAFLSIVGYVAAYPMVYAAAAWVFFYAFQRSER